MTESVISLQNLMISFGENEVLRGVNLEVTQGETLAIIGPSGSGKSTILKVLTGLLPPTGGKVFIEGTDVSALSEEGWNKIRRQVGMVFQYSALFDFLNVRENVAFGLRQHFSLPEEEIQNKVNELLKDVGMEAAAERFPVELSGGMKKRVSLARALAFDPRIVLYDEPTAGLDPIRTMSISRLIRATQKKHKITSVLVTHDMESVYVAADRVVLLNEGKIAAIGTPEEFKNSPDPLVRGFVTGEEIEGTTEEL
jgi:ABC transporter